MEDGIRAIDHLVLPVTTLGLARSRLKKLGFTVAPDAHHPFGTGNCCVFFENRTYLEPVTILDRQAADTAASERNIFVRRIKRFSERRGDGFAMVALRSSDAKADQAKFEKAKISAGPLFRFSRVAMLADGSERELGFAIAHTETAAAPDASFFVCQHLKKDALFRADLLEHPNGANGVSTIVAVADTPEDFRPYLISAAGQQKLLAPDGGIEASGKSACILILSPAAFRARYELDPPNPRGGMLFAAFELGVLELDRAAGYAGAQAKRRGDVIIVPPAPGLNAVLAFRSEATND